MLAGLHYGTARIMSTVDVLAKSSEMCWQLGVPPPRAQTHLAEAFKTPPPDILVARGFAPSALVSQILFEFIVFFNNH
mgnify:CR=1 FL=1